MSGLSYLFNGRFRADPFPRLRDSEADTAPPNSDEAKRIVQMVRETNLKPSGIKTPRVIPSRRR